MFKQMIRATHLLPITLTCFDASQKNNYIKERYSTTLKLKRESENMENIASVMGFCPRNGYKGGTGPAMNVTL